VQEVRGGRAEPTRASRRRRAGRSATGPEPRVDAGVHGPAPP
jgi:hypothetical protein